MAIDDNTLYGLTGAQVKELPEKIEAVKGLAKVLTADDYNYPANNPTKIAVWLLPDGAYNAKGIDAWWSTGTANSDVFFIKGTTSNNAPYAIQFAGTSMVLHSLSSSGSFNNERIILSNSDVINNLTSASTTSPLSANQGRVLKNLIDAIAVPTKTSDLTNDGSDGTSTYVEADELPTVNNATLTIQANGTTVNSFTANASSNVTANIPSATTSRYGVTQLSSSTSSTSTSLAATPSAVKSAYDLANGKAKITMTSTDPGEGSTLAANNYVAVYGTDALVQTADIADGAVTSGKIDFTTLGFGNYSTSEVDTGFTWIDGKHIYKKTLQNTLSGSENSVDVSSCNIDTLIDWKNIVVIGNSQQIIGFRLGDDTSSDYLMTGVQYNISAKTLRFAFGSQYQGSKTVYSTIWYTKAS